MKEENLKDGDDLVIYELGYHLLPTVAEADLSSEVSKIHSILSLGDSTIIAEGAPSLRQLAYDITKKIDTKNLNFNKAYFGWIKFEVDRAKINDISKKLENFSSILRFILVKTVRENTMSVQKVPSFAKENREEKELKVLENPEVKEAEIDKSIDELVSL